jgi:hypothetical protein
MMRVSRDHWIKPTLVAVTWPRSGSPPASGVFPLDLTLKSASVQPY